MTAHYEGNGVALHHGDCLDVLRTLPDASVDSVVTDPPYGLEFMGKSWDSFKGANDWGRLGDTKPWTERPKGGTDPFQGDRPRFHAGAPFQQWCEQWAAECLRVLKPGGHMLAFGGTRTWHRLACAVEDAGFEVRDSIAWMYGSGFPKSLDVSKAIDKAEQVKWQQVAIAARARGDRIAERAALDALALAEREVVGERPRPDGGIRVASVGGRSGTSLAGSTDGSLNTNGAMAPITAPATPDAERWQGWGTALKPAFEPVVVARKPLVGTVAANVLTHGTGALNIDACRIEGEPWKAHSATGLGSVKFFTEGENPVIDKAPHGGGRWPANVVLDESQADALDEQSGTSTSPSKPVKQGGFLINGGRYGSAGGDCAIRDGEGVGYGDTGGASRFFYVAKAPKKERPRVDGTAHPTVKPLTLMRWLVRLVTPPGGTVLEPFAGSGTTVEACIVEGFRCVAIEKTDEYLPLIVERIRRATDGDRVADEVARVVDVDQALAEQVTHVEPWLFELDGDAS